MGFLDEVISYKRHLIEKIKNRKGYFEDIIKSITPPLNPDNFLEKEGINIIAEVKKSSPSLGKIKAVDVGEQASMYEKGKAFAISVLTEDKFFSGSLDDLRKVRETVNIPVLRKDFIIDEIQIYEARAYGADMILLIVKVLDGGKLQYFINLSKELGMTPLVEIFSLKEVEKAIKAGADYIGINNRDLVTLKVDLSVSEMLLPEIKKVGAKNIVIESGIESKEDVLKFFRMGANIFLIGTSLMKSGNPVKKLHELRSCVLL